MAEPIKTEQWKVIKNFPNYAVSTNGRVKRILSGAGAKVGRILKPCHAKGYPQVRFYSPNKPMWIRIHHIVLETFVGVCPKGYITNHLDGNKSNNHLDNLEWCTLSQNQKHAYSLGLTTTIGELNGNHKLSKKDVIHIRNLFKTGCYQKKQLAKRFNVSDSHISKIILLRTWKHI